MPIKALVIWSMLQTGSKKLKDASLASFVPKTYEEWSTFEMSDEILSIWTHELTWRRLQWLRNSAIRNFYSLHCYVRLKLINLCVELNLVNSVGFHHQALVSFANANVSGSATASTAAVGSLNIGNLQKIIQIDAGELS